MIEITAFEIVMIALAGALVLLAGVVAGAFIAFYAMDKMCEDDDVLEEITKEIEGTENVKSYHQPRGVR